MRITRHPLAIGVGLSAGLAPLAYPLFLRRRCLTWGARAEEAAMKLPGDELLPDAGLVTTRAITIDAPPDAIWPWLVQMGSGRGGAYTYAATPEAELTELISLGLAGALSVRLGGSNILRAVVRVVIGGALGLAFTYGIGHLFGTAIG